MEQKSRQASIKDWTEKGKDEAKIIPEVRKEQKTTTIEEKVRTAEQEGAGGDEKET